MSVYVIAQLAVHDEARYSRYMRSFAATLRPFRGRLLAADPDPELLEGPAAPDKVVVLEFDSREEAGRWASSDAYQAIATDRRAAADCLVLAVRALPTGRGARRP